MHAVKLLPSRSVIHPSNPSHMYRFRDLKLRYLTMSFGYQKPYKSNWRKSVPISALITALQLAHNNFGRELRAENKKQPTDKASKIEITIGEVPLINFIKKHEQDIWGWRLENRKHDRGTNTLRTIFNLVWTYPANHQTNNIKDRTPINSRGTNPIKTTISSWNSKLYMEFCVTFITLFLSSQSDFRETKNKMACGKNKLLQFPSPVHEDRWKRLNENNHQRLEDSAQHALLLCDQIWELEASAYKSTKKRCRTLQNHHTNCINNIDTYVAAKTSQVIVSISRMWTSFINCLCLSSPPNIISLDPTSVRDCPPRATWSYQPIKRQKSFYISFLSCQKMNKCISLILHSFH